MKRLLLTIPIFIFIQCGLPDSTSINLNQLNKPTFNVYNNLNSIVIDIEGYYPTSDHPDFEGYNIYIGDNNEPNEIIKRVLHIDYDDRLPSKSATSTSGTVSTRVEISEFKFRFTTAATDTDLSIAGVSRGDLLKRNFSAFEKYYFIVKAKESSREGVTSDTAKLIFIDYHQNQVFNFPVNGSAAFNLVNTFNALKLGKVGIFPENIDGNAYTLSVGTLGRRSDVFDYPNIPKEDNNYVTSWLTPLVSNLYIVKAVGVDTQYLKFYVVSMANDSMVISYGHEKEQITNLDDNLIR